MPPLRLRRRRRAGQRIYCLTCSLLPKTPMGACRQACATASTLRRRSLPQHPGNQAPEARALARRKRNVITSTFLTPGGLLSSIVDSILVKSTWTSSSGVYTLMRHRGALGTAPSKVQHHWQPHTRALQSSTIMGNQKHQHSFYLSLGHGTKVEQPFTQDQAIAHTEEGVPLLHVHLAAQIFL